MNRDDSLFEEKFCLNFMLIKFLKNELVVNNESDKCSHIIEKRITS